MILPPSLLTATAGSRALDAEIARALGWTYDDGFMSWRKPDKMLVLCGPYEWSTDLSSAVALWREQFQGWDIRIASSFNRDGDIWWHVDARDSFFEPEEGEANPWTIHARAEDEPALAVIRALFAAREAGEAG